MLYDLGRWDEVLEGTARVLAFVGLPRANFGSSLCRTWLMCSCVEAALLRPPFLSRSSCRSHVMLVMRRSWFRRSPRLHSSNKHAETFLLPRVSSKRSSRPTRGISDFHRARFLDELAAVCVEAGDLDLVRRLLDSIRMTAGRAGHSLVAARGVLVEADGDPEAALLLFEEAAKRWGEYGFVFGRGLALLGSARCLLALGRTTDATPVLHQARDIFAALGAAPTLAEVDALLGDQPAAARAAK